jgi:hypothetical protein
MNDPGPGIMIGSSFEKKALGADDAFVTESA